MSVPGPRPEGSPDGMREYATQLRRAATDLDVIADGAPRSAENATFEGPLGDRVRERVGNLRLRGHTAARELRYLADDIAQRAGGVEAALRDWELAMERVQSEPGPNPSRGGPI